MLRIMLAVGGLAFLASTVTFTVDTETRNKVLGAGRTLLGFVNKNSHVGDEYLKCMELNPKQPEACKERLIKNVQEVNSIKETKASPSKDGGK